MSISNHRFVVLCRNWLSKFSGEDYKIIHDAKTDKKVKANFAFIGAFVLIITLISFYSSAHFIYQLFNRNLLVAVPIGVFWCLMVGNIYVLLLYTITPKIFTGKVESKKPADVSSVKTSFFINASVGLRIGFVVLIAIIIAQPWLITTFSSSSNAELLKYKQQYRNDFIIQSDSLLIEEESKIYRDLQQRFNLVKSNQKDSLQLHLAGLKIFLKINEDIYFLSQAHLLKQEISTVKNKRSSNSKRKIDSLNQIISSLVANEIATDSLFVLHTSPINSSNAQITNLLTQSQNSLITTIKEKNRQYQKLDEVINKNNFYIRQLQIINSSSPLAWGMTLMVVFAFIFPIYLKYRVRNKSNFYQVKKDLEHRIVNDEYKIFKLQYRRVLSDNYRIDADFYESYLDPPYNTRKKHLFKNYDNESELLSKIYEDEESGDANKYVISDNIS